MRAADAILSAGKRRGIHRRIDDEPDSNGTKKPTGGHKPPVLMSSGLQDLNVLSLPSLLPFDHVELDCLAFLQALESIALNSAKVDKYIFTALPGDKTKSLGIVKPFHCSLFHLLFHLLSF